MKGYAAHGVNSFVLTLGYKGWAIKEFFLNYQAMISDLTVHLGRPNAVELLNGTASESWDVTLAETGESTQTGGRIWAARSYLEKEDLFCATYGDGVSDVDVGSLIAF